MPKIGASLWIQVEKKTLWKYQAARERFLRPRASIQTLLWIARLFRNHSREFACVFNCRHASLDIYFVVARTRVWAILLWELALAAKMPDAVQPFSASSHWPF